MSLQKLTQLAHDQVEAETKVAEAEAQLDRSKKRLRDICENQIPELMDEEGLSTFKTDDGIEITVKKEVLASISKERAPKAFQWLRENGHAKLIKRKITVQARDDAHGDEIIKKLGKEEVTDQPSVHAQTLGAFVREMMSKGKSLPTDLLGIHVQAVSKVKLS